MMRPRAQWLFHPESPGVRVLVVRTWIGRLWKTPEFATPGEVAIYHAFREKLRE